MQNIDFEQLRKDALESCTANLPDDSIGRMIQKQAEPFLESHSGNAQEISRIARSRQAVIFSAT